MKKRIALITHEAEGGLGTMTAFLHRTIAESGLFEPELFFLTTSSNHVNNSQLRKPSTWLRGGQLVPLVWRDIPAHYVGVSFADLEFQRYKPRPAFDALLENCDLIQFVVGSAPWVCATENILKPKVVWTATTTRPDRASRTERYPFLRRTWANWMTHLAERYEKRGLAESDRVVALTEYTADGLRALGYGKELLIAPCGIDVNHFKPPAGGPGDYIVSVARFSDHRKNVRMMLEAYRHLRSRLPSAPELWLVGDAPSPREMEELRRSGHVDSVRFLGPASGRKLAGLLCNAAIFILSSDEEGLGIVILEAMACGLPVVSTASGGPNSIVVEGKTGFLTPTRDAIGFSTAIEKLVRDKELRTRLGSEGRRLLVEKYSRQKVGTLFLNEYSRLLGMR
jgi:D-inositol-3-phosphate glycosyltransferase